MYIARHFLQVISCVDHTCLSVALVSFQVVQLCSRACYKQTIGCTHIWIVEKEIRLLFLLVHRKGTVDKDISEASVAPINAQDLDHI